MALLTLFVAVFAVVMQTAVGNDYVKHVRLHSTCSEVYSRRTLDCRWTADLDAYADQEILKGCHVIAYKIQWFGGSWSAWVVPGINSLDWKVNLARNRRYRYCRGTYLKHNTMRYSWSYFYDHNHRYIKCCPRPAYRPFRGDEEDKKYWVKKVKDNADEDESK